MASSPNPKVPKGATAAIRRARRRGRLQRLKDLRAAGGGLTADEVQTLLEAAGLEPLLDTDTDTRFLAVPVGRKRLYPACQFCDGRPLAGLAETLAILELDDPWFKLHWLLNDRSLFDRAPLDLLRSGEVHKAIAVAEAYGEQKPL